MVIEQSLMKGIKSIGGLTHGRGITENTLMRWATCGPICSEVTEAIEVFTSTHYVSSQQHIEERPSRIDRDVHDVNIFYCLVDGT
jgi:hypothetical protein